MSLLEINKRYSELATSDCCLSCGGAIDYATPQPGEVCVDLGSGRGTDVLRMAETIGENGMAIGIDISDGMIKKAQENAERFKVSNVQFVQSELEKINLPDETADLVISNCTINHANDKQTVWNEIFRILKKGGRFAISDIYSSIPVPEEFRKNPVAVAECWAGAVTKNDYLDQLNKAGFKSVTILEESAPYPKGKITVSSWTISGKKPNGKCCE
jgi:arsenite methyltransferase